MYVMLPTPLGKTLLELILQNFRAGSSLSNYMAETNPSKIF